MGRKSEVIGFVANKLRPDLIDEIDRLSDKQIETISERNNSRAATLEGIMSNMDSQTRQNMRLPTPASPGERLSNFDPISPLILDLDGDGVEASEVGFFDHGGDGFRELTHWVGRDDGLLVWDRNRNGAIEDGGELFGENMVLPSGAKAANGFLALASFDSNNDGTVSPLDANWNSLRLLVWIDDDGDGQKDSMNLATLNSMGVRSLDIASKSSSHVDAYGNRHFLVGNYTKTDGTRASMADVLFRVDHKTTAYSTNGIPSHSSAIMALPNVVGEGRVYDLRDAMALDDIGQLASPFYSGARTEARTLRQLVDAFRLAESEVVREELTKKILLRWTGAESASVSDYTSRTTLTQSVEKIAVVEAFMGVQWQENQTYRLPATSTAQKIEDLYKGHYEYLWGSLMLQTHLSSLTSALTVSTNAIDDASNISFEGIVSLGGEGNSNFLDLLRAFSGLGLADWIIEQINLTVPSLSSSFNYYKHAELSQEFIRGDESNNSLSGKERRADNFDANAGGNDTLYGKSGNDTYWLGQGTGFDVIKENHYLRSDDGDAGDVIRIKPNVDVVKVRVNRDTDHLYVSILDSHGSVTDRYQVFGHFSNGRSKIEQVADSYGKALFSASDLAEATFQGTSGVDHLSGNDGFADHFDANAGGNDYLYGKGGDDIYWLGRGTGNDRIVEKHYMRLSSGDSGDVIRLGAGLTVDDVRLWRDTDHLYVALTVPSGSMRDRYQVENYYRYEQAKVERVELFDGTTVLDSDDFVVAPVRGSASNDRLQGNDGAADHFDADAGGDDYLYGKGGDDVYWLRRGTGNDRIVEKHYMRLSSGDSGDVIRLGARLTVDDVRLWRDTDHLYVALTVPSGSMRDRYQVENYYRYEQAKVERVELSDGATVLDSDDFAIAPIRGSASNDRLQGNNGASDHFDADAGGDDYLYGKGGDDVYWLRRGTGNDRIVENHYMRLDSGDSGDVVRLGTGLTADDVHLSRDADHLYISLTVTSGPMRDRYLVQDHYRYERARIERVELSDGTTVLDSDDFAAALIRGTTANDQLWGRHGVSDSFDADAGGNDRLYGKGGNDIYWLGVGTGRDVIFERYMNPGGDSADRIKIESGFDAHNVEFRREGSHLTVKLFDSSNAFVGSLRIDSFYSYAASRVEHVEAGGRTFSTSRAEAYITALRNFESDSASSEYDTLQALVDDYWV